FGNDVMLTTVIFSQYRISVLMIIGHTACGVQGMDGAEMVQLMKDRGIDDEHISLMKHCGIDLEAWLHGFDDTQEAILETVDLVKNHPLVPKDVVVRGYIMDSGTGELERL
ncbi:MAG: carbonic anhydrase, partial [Bacteroidales bacterium]|nr:carbonic anhydrase [Bacteroidales bacterium]